MKRYRLVPDQKKKKIYVRKATFFGEVTLQTFKNDQYTAALDFLKYTGAKNRPSRATILDAHGNLRKQWEYTAKAKPRPYETNPRKRK